MAGRGGGKGSGRGQIIDHVASVPAVENWMHRGDLERRTRRSLTHLQHREELSAAMLNIAFVTLKDVYDADGNLIPVQDLPDEVAMAVKSERFDKDGALIGYVLHDKTKMFPLLARCAGLDVRRPPVGVGGPPSLSVELTTIESSGSDDDQSE